MHDWVAAHLREYRGVNLAERRAWWITLHWYFGYCSKKQLGNPMERENGRVFWRDAVKEARPEPWQEAQWAAALKWFFEELAANDRAGKAMRGAIRRRHLAYTTEKSYMSWLWLKELVRLRVKVKSECGEWVDALGGLQGVG